MTSHPPAAPHPLVGALVELHPITERDIDALLALRASSPAALERWVSWSRADLLDIIGEQGSGGWWISVDDDRIGFIQHYAELDPDYRHAGMDIFIVERGQGRGAGTDAVRTLARHLIEELGHHRLIIDPAADNAPAIRTYEKVGFRPVGVMRQYERGVDGSFHDGLLMDLLAADLA